MTEVVRWGIIGTASIADKIGKAIANADGARLIGIASRDIAKAEAWADERNVPARFGSYESILDDDNIDAVYIPLPPSMHMEWTINAAEKGKHVLCEKPLAMDVRQVEAMRDVCRHNEVLLMDGAMWVHHLRTTSMKKQLDNGALGTLRRVTAAFTFKMAADQSENIRLQRDLGGGSLGDLGYYPIRAILWAFEELPLAVFAAAREESGVDLNVSALLWFDDDRMAAFDCSFDTYSRQWFEIAGTEGSLVCDDFVVPAADEPARYWLHQKRMAETKTVAVCRQEVLMIEAFSAAISAGERNQSWVEDALKTTVVCEALRRSWTTGQRIELNS